MNDDDEYVEEIRLVRRKRDTYRSNSSKSDEFESDLLRSKSTKSVAGPTESRPLDEEALRRTYQDDSLISPQLTPDRQRELSPGQQALAEAIVEFGTVLIRDLVVPLVREVALPAAKAKFGELAERRRVRALERVALKAKALNEKVVELEVMVDGATVQSETVTVATPNPAVSMSRSAYLLAQLQLKLAEDFSSQQRQLLAQADVTEEDVPPELEQSLSLMLEGHADELNDDQREAVAVFLRQAGRPMDPALAIDPDTVE